MKNAGGYPPKWSAAWGAKLLGAIQSGTIPANLTNGEDVLRFLPDNFNVFNFDSKSIWQKYELARSRLNPTTATKPPEPNFGTTEASVAVASPQVVSSKPRESTHWIACSTTMFPGIAGYHVDEDNVHLATVNMAFPSGCIDYNIVVDQVSPNVVIVEFTWPNNLMKLPLLNRPENASRNQTLRITWNEVLHQHGLTVDEVPICTVRWTFPFAVDPKTIESFPVVSEGIPRSLLIEVRSKDDQQRVTKKRSLLEIKDPA